MTKSPNFLRESVSVSGWPARLTATMSRALKRHQTVDIFIIPVLRRKHFSVVICDLSANIINYYNSLPLFSLSNQELVAFQNAVLNVTNNIVPINVVSCPKQYIIGNDCLFWCVHFITTYLAHGIFAVPSELDCVPFRQMIGDLHNASEPTPEIFRLLH